MSGEALQRRWPLIPEGKVRTGVALPLKPDLPPATAVLRASASRFSILASAIHLQSVWFNAAFHCFRCHPMLCKSLCVRFFVDSNPIAPTTFQILSWACSPFAIR